MKDFPTLQEYLLSEKVDASTPIGKIEVLKKHYRREYLKAYEQQRKSREKRIEMRLTPSEYKEFQQANTRYGKRFVGRFIKECAMAYLGKTHVFPNQKIFEQVLTEIRRIGINVNQLTTFSHAYRDYANEDRYKHLEANIEALEAIIALSSKQVHEVDAEQLGELIESYLKRHPEHKKPLLEHVQTLVSQPT